MRLSFPRVNRASFPVRSFIVSMFAHGAALCGILLLPSYVDFGTHPRVLSANSVDLGEERHITYLPRIGGGSEANGQRGGGSAILRKGTSATPARGTKGFSYPGPQAILSDPPKPTNRIQTILQPGIKTPRALKPLIPVPNIVRTANADPLPSLVEPTSPAPPAPVRPDMNLKAPTQNKPKAAEPAAPVIVSAATAQVDPTKLSLPASAIPRPVVPEMNAPTAHKRGPENNQTAPAQYAPTPTHGSDLQNLLALSPTPAAPGEPVEVPAGESRGRFAISPEPNFNSPKSEPGSNAGGTASAAGLGNQSELSTGNPAGDGQAGISNGASRLAIGGAGGTGLGTGKDSGPGNGGTGTDAGRGSGSGAGVGAGAGSSPGSGSGAGAGRGGGAFPGMTIQGGSLETGTAGAQPMARAAAPIAPRSGYGMTVLSTANSGGGLGDYGVFSHEAVYTVYVDMRQSAEDRAPSWTLQCAALQRTQAPADKSVVAPTAADQGFVPPYPITKEQPKLPAELVRKYLPRTVVVYAVITAEGKVEQASVKQSPDPQLNKLLLDALNKWTFRPGELNGNPVPVKMLLGIPLYLPPGK